MSARAETEPRPGSLLAEMQLKLAIPRSVRLLDPDAGRVEIHRPDRPVEVLDRPTALSGEDVLPGFTLDLKGILFD